MVKPPRRSNTPEPSILPLVTNLTSDTETINHKCICLVKRGANTTQSAWLRGAGEDGREGAGVLIPSPLDPNPTWKRKRWSWRGRQCLQDERGGNEEGWGKGKWRQWTWATETTV